MTEERTTPSLGARLAAPILTVTGNLGLAVATVVLAILVLLFGWMSPSGRWMTLMSRTWAWILLWSGGTRLEMRFATPLSTDRPYIYMANHQSLADIPALVAGLPGQTRFLAKQSLFKIPLFGWAIKRNGFISIDRTDRSRAGQSFAEAIETLQGGFSAVVFPEGTRSSDGKLLPFQRGGFLLALKSDLPIVPVGIYGSRLVRAKGSLWIRPGRVVVSCGRPLETSEYGVRDKTRLIEDVRRRVLALSSG